MECDPPERLDVVQAACPFASSVPLPIVAVLSRKLTTPVGVPEDDVTVAVNVTGSPYVDGFADDASAVVVAIRPFE